MVSRKGLQSGLYERIEKHEQGLRARRGELMTVRQKSWSSLLCGFAHSNGLDLDFRGRTAKNDRDRSACRLVGLGGHAEKFRIGAAPTRGIPAACIRIGRQIGMHHHDIAEAQPFRCQGNLDVSERARCLGFGIAGIGTRRARRRSVRSPLGSGHAAELDCLVADWLGHCRRNRRGLCPCTDHGPRRRSCSTRRQRTGRDNNRQLRNVPAQFRNLCVDSRNHRSPRSYQRYRSMVRVSRTTRKRGALTQENRESEFACLRISCCLLKARAARRR